MKAIVLLNSAAGALAAVGGRRGAADVRQAFARHEVEAEVWSVLHKDLASSARAAAALPVDVVVVGGGDGTVSTVAGVLAGTDMPLAVLPLGTLNHFAKDLGIPMDLPGAVRAIAAGNVQRIDVGRVNDRVFINNSSLGVYPRAVLERDAQRSRWGLGKWAAMAIASLKVLRRFPMAKVRLTAGSEVSVRQTPVVFVGNNHYQLDLLNVGKRLNLDRGELSLYFANTNNRWGMFMLTVRAMVGRLRQARDFEALSLTNFSIETRRKQVHVAIDGEVVKLRPPLYYRVCPQSLRVHMPPPAVEPAGLSANSGAATT